MTFAQNVIAGVLDLSVFRARATPFGSFLWAIWSNWKDVLDAALIVYCGLMDDRNLTGFKQPTLAHNSVGQKSVCGMAGFSALGHIRGWPPSFGRTTCLSGAPGAPQGSCGLEKNPVPRGCRREAPVFLLTVIQGSLSAPRGRPHFLTQQLACSKPATEFLCVFKSLKLPSSARLILGTTRENVFYDEIEFCWGGTFITFVKPLWPYNLRKLWEWDLIRFTVAAHD